MPMVPTPVVPAPVMPIHGLEVVGRDGALKRGRSEREGGRRAAHTASIAAPARTAIAAPDNVRETMVILLFILPCADDALSV
jgi:hypothetical protein